VVGDPGIEPGVSRLEGVTVPCHTLRPVAQTLLKRWIICPARGVNGQINMGEKKAGQHGSGALTVAWLGDISLAPR